jgi:ferric-dicitrate binding protein FerR (iron transport regulator)
MNRELLEKYCSNCCSPDELQEVLSWFRKSAGTYEGRNLLYRLWEELPEEYDTSGINFNLMLDRIHHEVNLNRSKELLQVSHNNPVRFRKRERFIRILVRIAAILILPALGLNIYLSYRNYYDRQVQNTVNQAYNEVFSSVDAITKVVLPDGSNVWLNHSSSLKYPAMFDGKSRITELTGEGYFEVVPDSKIPFIVKTDNIQIKATGTAFNVMAHPDDSHIEASLIDGKVEIGIEDKKGDIATLLMMKPKDLADFDKIEQKIRVQTITDDRYFSWKEGKLVFNKEPMAEVAKKLGRWFNADIQINDPALLELTYTATFVQETLPQVLELMAMVSPVKYSISNREKTGNGTFTKRKIILSYRKNEYKSSYRN